MDDPVPEEEPCEQCGLCCRIFGPGIAPTAANVYAWMEQGRTDILRWFVAFVENGSTTGQVPDLAVDDLGGVVVFEMRDHSNRRVMSVCPFLRRVAKERYLCGIHAVKPEMCCTYQPWIWGETYFNRCKSLKKNPSKVSDPGRADASFL